MEIAIDSQYPSLPLVYKTKTGNILKLPYTDTIGRRRALKKIKPKKHMGISHYRINGKRYSATTLSSMESKMRNTIIEVSGKSYTILTIKNPSMVEFKDNKHPSGVNFYNRHR